MKILGLVDSQYDAGACLFDDDRLIAAINEERLNRIKLSPGFPELSIRELLDYTRTKPREISQIVVGSIASPAFVVRFLRRLQNLEKSVRENKSSSFSTFLSDFVKYRLKLTSYLPNSALGRIDRLFAPAAIRKDLPPELKTAPLRFIEHHEAHAASAFYCSGFDEALCITADSFGDGISLTINRCRHREMTRLFSMAALNSFGKVYTMFTQYLGFLPNRHEGKILGLSASGDSGKIAAAYPFTTIDGKPTYTEKHGRYARRFLEQFEGYKREDIAAWLQLHTEREITRLVQWWLERTKQRCVVMAGGVFANVKLNQRVSQLPGVESAFVFPHMGDGGLAAGAVLAHLKPAPVALRDVYLGPDFSPATLAAALQQQGAVFEQPACMERDIAEELSHGKIVARFDGRMEYGPRALGNRSILCQAIDPGITEVLNRKLHRNEFMPFAPATIMEAAPEYYEHCNGLTHAAQFMTLTFDCTPRMKQEHPAAVHLDGTARPQLVGKEINPSFYAVLDEYRKLTGLSSVINTSFNLHEEPIVCSPTDAIKSFHAAELDSLAIGPFLVKKQPK